MGAAEVEDADFSDMQAEAERMADFEDAHSLGGPRHVRASP